MKYLFLNNFNKPPTNLDLVRGHVLVTAVVNESHVDCLAILVNVIYDL
jgi:hypothetical protein